MCSWLVEIDEFQSREIAIYELRQTALNSHVILFGNQWQKRTVCYTTPLLYYNKKQQFLSSLNIHGPITLDRIMGNHFNANLVNKLLQQLPQSSFLCSPPFWLLRLLSHMTFSWLPGLVSIRHCCFAVLFRIFWVWIWRIQQRFAAAARSRASGRQSKLLFDIKRI